MVSDAPRPPWLRLCWLVLAWCLLWPSPASARVDLHPPLEYAVVLGGHEREVMALLAPWQLGQSATQGWTLQGAAVEQDRICYEMAAGPRVRVCLLRDERAATLDDGTLQQSLAGGYVLAARPTAGQDPAVVRTLLAAVSARITENRTQVGLDGLWKVPLRVQRRPAAPAQQGLLESEEAQRILDIALWLPLLALWLLVATARAVRDLPGRGWPWVLGLLAFSAWTRATLPVQAPMTAWSWTRMTNVGRAVMDSPLINNWLADHGGVFVDDAHSLVMRVVSTLTPLALLGHARKLLGDSRAALLAALLLAASPHALRFAAADDQFTPSMLFSCSAFFFLYTALEAEAWWHRALRMVVLLPLLWLALTARPLNLVYVPLMLAALAIAAQGSSRGYRLVLGAEVLAMGSVVLWRLVHDEGGAVSDGLSLRTLQEGWSLFLSSDYNPLLFWRLTPPAWTVLIVLGSATLLGRRWPALQPEIALRRGIWLVAWVVGFIVLHGAVLAPEPMNNARYQLHSLPAMAIAAGAGLWAWWLAWRDEGKRRWLVAAVLSLCLGAPWLHREAIAETRFDVMQEWLFLRDLRDRGPRDGSLPRGCTVVEILRPRDGHAFSKLQRLGMRMGDRDGEQLWKTPDIQRFTEANALMVTSTGVARAAQSMQNQTADRVEKHAEWSALSASGRQLLDRPPRCLAFYEGPECATGPGDTQRHPLCRQVLASGNWSLLAQTQVIAPIYDRGLTWHLRDHQDPINLRMWRAVQPPAAARGAAPPSR